VRALGEWSPLPVTYAGGGRALTDLALVDKLGRGRVGLTFGSALDLFGGDGVRYGWVPIIKGSFYADVLGW
jgi:phosphoribosylformimino-5-aminoimidazole carboxamide ribotide isomerase